MGSSWSRKVDDETENTLLGVHRVRIGNDTLGYFATTRLHGRLSTPAIPAEDDEQSVSDWHVSVAACSILAGVIVFFCCGVWLGVQLSTIRVSRSGVSNDAHHHHPASIAHVKDVYLIQANRSAALVPADANDNVRGATAAQQQRLGQKLLPWLMEKQDFVSETTFRPHGVIVTGSTIATTSIASTSTWTSSSSSSSSTSTMMRSNLTALPSLFCFSIMRRISYELSLVRMQVAKGLGIFGCDAYSVFSDEKTRLTTALPMRIDSVVFGFSLQAEAGTKKHIPNIEILLKAWEHVKADGLYRKHDWVVKVDPDAVFFPQRLRHRLVRITVSIGDSLYLLNCRLSFGLGALEIMSRVALLKFYDGLERCKQVLPWRFFGEDMFLRNCLDFLGVASYTDFSLLSDGFCGEQPSPCISGKVAFHPFKNVKTYLKCTHEASD